MILSTQTAALSYRLGDEAAVRILSQAGFDAIDFSMFINVTEADHPLGQSDFRSYTQNLRQIADQSGIVFNQAHAPFPTYKENEPAYNKKIFADIVRALEISSILGAEIVVVHPVFLADEQAKKNLNLDIYQRLQPYCAEFSVKVALENMWGINPESGKNIPNVCSSGAAFAEYIDALDSRYFTGCLDLGHCGLVGEDAAEMIRQLGPDRLLALHVHDNDLKRDVHTAPFLGKMNWQTITAALSEIDYAGDLTLEADNFLVGMPTEFLPTAVRFLHDIGRQLIKMIQGDGSPVSQK